MAYGNLANKGRYGDTEIRNVAGRKSHVNRKEAGLIDLYGMLGQNLVQREGAGTRNPMTGMPEYHTLPWYNPTKSVHKAWHWTQDNIIEPIGEGVAVLGEMVKYGEGFISGDEDTEAFGQDYDFSESGLEAQVEGIVENPEVLIGDLSNLDEPMGDDIGDNFNKDAYKEALIAGTQKDYLKKIGVPDNKLEYFESNIDMDQLGYMEDKYKTGSESNVLATGRNLKSIYDQTSQAEVKSGFESSGAIDYASKTAKTGVFQDYKLQQEGLQTQLASSKSTFFQGATEEFWANLESSEI